MSKPLILAVGVILTAGILTGGLYWNKQRRLAATIQAHLLPPPSPKGLHPELGIRITELNRRTTEGPNRVESLAELSSLYHANGYMSRAWQNYRILIELDEKNPLWPYRLATIVSNFGHLDDSVTLYRNAIKLDSEYTPAHIHLGDTLLKLNRYEQAQHAYQSAYDKDPSSPFALFGLARVALTQDDTKIAQRLLESARRSNKRIGGDLLADVYETLGETSKARALLHDVTWSSHVDIPDPWIDDLASVCYDSFEVAMAGGKAGRRGNTTRAIELLKKAISLDPLDQNAHNHLAETYVAQGDLNQARLAYEACIKVSPTFDRGWAGLISVELKSGNQSRASQIIDQAIAKCPNSYVINNYKGEDLIKKTLFREAIPFFETSVRAAPEKAVGYNYLARAYLNLRQNELALEQLQKALKAEPSNSLALNLITVFHILAGDSVQAETFLQKAVLSPRISEEDIAQLQAMFDEKFKR